MALSLFLCFAALIVFACGLAWWRGGAPERAAAGMFLIAWLASIATDGPTATRYRGVQINYLLIDFALLLGLLMLARFANRRWPVLAASLQMLIVLAHVARALSPHQVALVYMIMTTVWPYVQLFLLLGGIVLHWRRTAILGAVPSWSSSSATFPAATPPGSLRG
ncbi:hypothetical protein AB2M62_10710 [Sphingomonas sp. MMS12-HWE2-04]|uniref:hypothetical protein n=1 Tax=Sphingomonas sp. MMS12-HWE2-04 TaxID=3234199 RepID=UPI00384C897B